MSRPSGSRHSVQASRSRVKSSRTRCATIWETPRRRVRAQDGGVLCVYREVQVLKKAAAKAEKSKKPVAIVSYDEKPRIQAIATTAPDLPPRCQAAMRASRGIMSTNAMARSACWPGSICSPARSTRSSGKRYRSREFIEFLKLLDAAYPARHRDQADPRQSFRHTFRGKPRGHWLDTRPPGRFDFTFTPKHGSWLNLIEGFFSKFAQLRPCAISE